MPSSDKPPRGGGPSPSQVQDRATADPAGLDRPDDHARLEGALECYETARHCPPNRAWASRMMAALRERDFRSATS